ncbi:putative quinol monooxygenase [Curtobacterium sp. BH-2-1-1]|uniref:putative quinol monooxygenase n=1 Tax=Curtobacterium sp. BH-2-1-1 TaxID=1905847 RepID=UPI0009F30EB0|nr:putative quinol monooxygenase [Curtobacterium sp. BH-2-1-1]
MSIAVIAEIEPVPYNEEPVQEALLAAVDRVRSEDAGCERYDLHWDDKNGRFVMVERWADQAALDTHAAGAAFVALTTALEGRLAAPITLRILQPIGR